MSVTYKHTNKLIEETSPYLLQHAHNPVNWYPWGKEALQKAKEENKPILVSIGYAACHWCHVMERESFEDEATALIMNQYFINIKIDREERPDLDHIYMDAVQAITGSGGWPLNVFLTPETKPFYGGTYFPPVEAFNRISWKNLLENIHQSFTQKRNEIDAQAENLTGHLLNANNVGLATNTVNNQNLFTQENLNLIAENLLKQADTIDGGFGKAPKFPQTFSIQFLLRHYHFTKQENALQQALLSIDKMIEGGIYDHVGGGLSRYSTDNEWLAPHFEKMLYDNALLINVLAEAYQITQNEKYKICLEHILAFIERELMHKDVFFYSAIDADSEGVEGRFYTWQKTEIDTLLGNDSNLFCMYYNITESGNWEHTNIIRIFNTVENLASTFNKTVEEIKTILQNCIAILFNVREKRIRPQLDDKMLLSWNALMVTAYCKAYAATSNLHYKKTAENTIAFIEKKLLNPDGSFCHTFKNNQAKINAFLDDYAYTIQAYIHLQEITGNQDYLLKAQEITNYVFDNFEEDETAYFYFTHHLQEDIIVRKKELYDGAVPSGNAIMCSNLMYLATVFNNTIWQKKYTQMLQSLNTAIVRYPTSFGIWAACLQQVFYGTKEVVITGENSSADIKDIAIKYIPNKILVVANNNKYALSILNGKDFNKDNIYYLCKDYTCKQPVFLLKEFLLFF